MSAVEDLNRYFIEASGHISRFHDFRVGEALVDLAERIDRIEARQRASEQHDPDCDYVTSRNCGLSGCAVYHIPLPCTCWLSKTKEP